MEYAEQTLSQILPNRALTPGEVQEMLLPTVSALAFLHRNNLVHGQLKPSNILVVDNRLKLASDTIRPAEESTATIVQPSDYDPPEAKPGSFSAAGDIWSLGMTMVEALTQRLPPWPDSKSGTAYFAPALPPPLGQIVRQCLNRNPANRTTAAAIEAQIKPEQPPPVVAPSSKRRWFVPASAVLLVAVVAIWAGVHRLGPRILPERIPPTTASQSPPPPSTSRGASADRPRAPLANKPPSVLHEVIPDVPRRARSTIHGRIKVAVRVTVDRSGNVVEETMENHGVSASKYFARLATEAARQWKFAPADGQHKWLLQFEFTRGGATGHAAALGS
jgi:serine/threonine protein kinase